MNKELGPQIIDKLIEALGITIYALETKLGYKSRAVYHVSNSVNALSEGMIRRIIEQYPHVNYNFLKTGEGNVLLRTAEEQSQKNLLNIQGNAEQNFLNRISKIPDQLDNIEGLLKELLDKK